MISFHETLRGTYYQALSHRVSKRPCELTEQSYPLYPGRHNCPHERGTSSHSLLLFLPPLTFINGHFVLCVVFLITIYLIQLRNYAKNICAIISTFSFLNGSWVGGWDREFGQQMSDTCGKKPIMELCWATPSENDSRNPEPQEQASSAPQYCPLVGQLNGGCADARTRCFLIRTLLSASGTPQASLRGRTWK